MLSLPHLQYPKPKLAILALLTFNAVIYGFVDTLTSAVDAVTWLALLVIYELETGNGASVVSEKVLLPLRNVLIGVVVLVFVSYLSDSEWLDVANSLLWFALIAMLEVEVRWPALANRHGQTLWMMTIATFIGLFVMAGIWLWQGAWLDAYDAVLWIVAFAFIEVDIFHFLQRKQTQV